MKKFLLSFAALFMLASFVKADEWAWGAKVGANFSTVNGWQGAKTRKGVTAGLFIERMVVNNLAIESDLLYSMEGFRFKESGKTIDVNYDYVKMPIVLKYYIVDGLSLQGGAQMGYVVNKSVDANSSGLDLESGVNRFNVDLIAGLAYDFCFGLVLEGRYAAGVTKILNATSTGVSNGTLLFSAGWRF
ncbi:MAG: porin family protein [Rikenellaceae bacterium]